MIVYKIRCHPFSFATKCTLLYTNGKTELSYLNYLTVIAPPPAATTETRTHTL